MKIIDVCIALTVFIVLVILFLLATPLKYPLSVLIVALLLLQGYKTHWIKGALQSEMVSLSDQVQSLIDGKEIESGAVASDDLVSKLQHQMLKFSDQIRVMQRKETDERTRLQALIGDISHQLKTPLTNMKMYQSLFLETNEDAFLEKIIRQTEKLEWLVESLMKLSRIESGCIDVTVKNENINLTLLDVISQVHLKASNKDIMIDYKPEDILIRHDKKWSTEAIFNVVDNAVKYSQRQTKICLKVTENEMFHTVLVKDEGIGVSSEEVNHVFKRFYRSDTADDQEGIGLGLYLAQEIMRKQGGYIYCKPCRIGSEFHLNFRK
ncbi:MULTISPECIES: sensor histidine kinase KdpD [unclassified Fusibacter]|uniref:sensor histidine kinase n=1 Tax=unclassified Fusibacter TaxID=2624464 RepID=UPI0010116B77|nr:MULTISPECIES: HAMP domain-containing sensor histidine kinase [unclassified Fusibacter]MCK8058171.1 HAMP domain-containing histidine kinase [Fusibacter sp. A2]NPE20754.1 HAMP domain-containing histidine kinase [Fusibacter sp. A1]RXV62961.1 sensor histidine kinase [Fusibacter sp. A1]